MKFIQFPTNEDVKSNSNVPGGTKILKVANDNKPLSKKLSTDDHKKIMKWLKSSSDVKESIATHSAVKGNGDYRTRYNPTHGKYEVVNVKSDRVISLHGSENEAISKAGMHNSGKTESLQEKLSRHAIEVKARKGENVGHGGFNKVADKAAKEYGSKKAGDRVAASIMWKKYAKK